VRLAYKWDGGDPLTDELRLDLDLYRPLRRIAPHTIHDVSEALDAIHRQFEKWTVGSEGGLLVLSPEDRRRRNEKIMAEMRPFRAAARARGTAGCGCRVGCSRWSGGSAVTTRGVRRPHGDRGADRRGRQGRRPVHLLRHPPGEWLGHAPTGRRFERVDEVAIFRLRDGRIVHVWSLEDT
jgi:hypothetical protein